MASQCQQRLPRTSNFSAGLSFDQYRFYHFIRWFCNSLRPPFDFVSSQVRSCATCTSSFLRVLHAPSLQACSVQGAASQRELPLRYSLLHPAAATAPQQDTRVPPSSLPWRLWKGDPTKGIYSLLICCLWNAETLCPITTVEKYSSCPWLRWSTSFKSYCGTAPARGSPSVLCRAKSY